MCKMDKDVVAPEKPKLYKRYIDDIIRRRKKNEEDKLFHAINSHHPNINLTIENEPTKFLDTSLLRKGNSYAKSLHRKETKITNSWVSKVPKKYKKNAILSELHRAKKI